MLSVIIPAYNEEKRIEATICKIEEVLLQSGEPFEILVVNDGSRDGTLKVLRQMESPHLVVCSYETNRGKGGAVKYGIENASGEILVFTDADLPYPPENILKAKDLLAGEYDLILGSRVQNREGKKYPWYRSLMSEGFGLFVNLMLRLKEKDTQCGFKAFKKEAAREIFKRVTLTGWGFDVEMIFIAKKLGYRIGRLSVTLFHVNEGSKIHIVRDALRMMGEVLTVRRNNKKGLYR